ncbi:ribbon-helix-helix domain-containing protein [Methanococcus voltae]|nr:ribbon-helix-helix domain-containing protein [Methanococcus voltae]MBP2173075.1 metal-responsive CopG/Arc/MetJ family transcriptional regulator [Methanococcus voltae]
MSGKNESVRISVTMPRAYIEKLDEVTKKRYITKSEFFRRCIDKAYEEE